MEDIVGLRLLGSGRHAFSSRDLLVYILRFFMFGPQLSSSSHATLRTVRIIRLSTHTVVANLIL